MRHLWALLWLATGAWAICHDATVTALTGRLNLATYQASVFGQFQGTVQYNRESPAAATVAQLETHSWRSWVLHGRFAQPP